MQIGGTEVRGDPLAWGDSIITLVVVRLGLDGMIDSKAV